MTARCLQSVLAHGGAVLRSLIAVDDASPEPEMADALAQLALSDSRVRILRNDDNAGFVASCNRGLAERRGDAVLLNSDTLVTPGWLAELRDVVHADARTACASPLSNSATIFSVPIYSAETPVDRVDSSAVRAACARLPRWTEMPTGHGFCLYMRGDVLDVVGRLDPVFSPGYGEENDWVMRAQALGFVAKRANWAFVYHERSQSFGGKRPILEERAERILARRHPQYSTQVINFSRTLDSRIAAHAVRVATTGRLRVALDIRHLPTGRAGWDGYPIGLARALGSLPDVDLTLVVRQPSQADGISARIVRDANSIDDVEVVHSPHPVTDPAQLRLLFGSHAHAVITHHDEMPRATSELYRRAPAADCWRATTALALLAAQAAISVSERSRREITTEFGIPVEEIAITQPSLECEPFTANEESVELPQVFGERGPSAMELSWERIARLTLETYRAAVFQPTERSLRARRHLHDVLLVWAAVGGSPAIVSASGIRAAWRDLNRALGVRVRREFDRLRLKPDRRSA
jgi:GT2 family glycosyltransferase